MTDKKNITGFSPKALFLGEQKVRSSVRNGPFLTEEGYLGR